MAQPLLSKSTCRTALTVTMYAGVAMFLLPYLTGRIFTGVLIVVLGAALAVSAGLARCFLTEGDCSEPNHMKQHIP